MKKVILVFSILCFSMMVQAQKNVVNEWKQATNAENPFDEIGLKHNLICKAYLSSDYFKDVMKKKSKGEVKSSFKLFFEDCCKRNKMECCGGTGPYDPTPIIDDVLNNNFKTLQDLMYRRYKFSPICISYAKTIIDMDRHRSEQFIKQVFKLEKRIKNDSNLKREEKENLFKMASVARYSSLFWNQEAKNPQSQFMKKVDWERAGVVDTICGLVGPEGAAVGSGIDLIFQYFE